MNDQPIKLTAFEYTIMETLIRNRGKVVSKDSLMLQLYPDAELRESHHRRADGSAAQEKFRLNTHRTSSLRCAARAICSNCADEGTVAAYLPAVITGSLPAGDRRVVLVLSWPTAWWPWWAIALASIKPPFACCAARAISLYAGEMGKRRY